MKVVQVPRKRSSIVLTAISAGLVLAGCGTSKPSQASNISAVKQAWVGFFSGSTSAAKKVSLLQNGSKFAQIINEAAGLSISKTSAAKVSKVVINSSTTATVTYTIDLGGQPALQNQTGTAIKVNGNWVVGDASFCALLALEGQIVPACPATSTTAAG